MTQNKSLVSAIIPVYNCSKYISEAINSILNQNYQPIEIIIIDDGSTDNTKEVVKGFSNSIRYFYQNHAGPSKALNYGLKEAKGNYIALLDADDFWISDKITIQMDILINNPEIDIVFGHVEQFFSPELSQDIQKRISIPQKIIKGYIKGTMLAKKEVFSQIGLFDEKLILGEFIDWYLKTTENDIKSFMCPEVLMKRRIHTTNMGITQKSSRSDYVKVLKASLDRRRGVKRIE